MTATSAMTLRDSRETASQLLDHREMDRAAAESTLDARNRSFSGERMPAGPSGAE